jgi:hypothetical protein
MAVRLRIHEFGCLGAGPGRSESDGDPCLPIAVTYTTPEGTLAALKAAAVLARNLDARLEFIIPEVVPFRLPLDQPRVSVEFLKQRQEALVREAGLQDLEISVQICICRDRKETLGRLLTAPSLVVLGGRRGWWPTREQRLETFLARLGHHVVFIDSRAGMPPAELESSADRNDSPVPSAR